MKNAIEKTELVWKLQYKLFILISLQLSFTAPFGRARHLHIHRLPRLHVVLLHHELLGEKVKFCQGDDECTNDSEKQPKAKVKVADRQLNAKKAKQETGEHGDDELCDRDQLSIDVFH